MITQPENLTKDRLKAELKKHGVTFSHTQQKSYYVELYRQHVMGKKVRTSPRKRSEFSSDDDILAKRRTPKVTPVRKRYTKAATPETYQAEVNKMSDSEMARALKSYGVDVGPITASTRAVYQRKLARLMSEKVKAVQDKSMVASESDSDEFSSDSNAEGEGEEEVDVGGVEDYYQVQSKHQTDRTTPIKPVVYGTPSYKPTPRAGIQQSQQSYSHGYQFHYEQKEAKVGKDQPTAKKHRSRMHPPSKTYKYDASVALCWLWWLLQSFLVLSVSFIVAFIVFDYIANKESRLINWVFQICPWIQKVCFGEDNSE